MIPPLCIGRLLANLFAIVYSFGFAAPEALKTNQFVVESIHEGKYVPAEEAFCMAFRTRVYSVTTAFDFEQFAAFQRAAFQSPLAARIQSAQYYKWKYFTPEGPARIASVTEDDTHISSVTAIPLRFVQNGTALRVWHLVDLATSRHHRGKGLFSSAVQALRDALGPGTPIYSIPNSASRPGLLRAGFHPGTELRYWLSFPGSRIVERDSPASQVENSRYQLDISSSEMLHWRFETRPNVNYTVIRGCNPDEIAVYRRIGSGLFSLTVLMTIRDPGSLRRKVRSELCDIRGPLLAISASNRQPATQLGFLKLPNALAIKRLLVFISDFPDAQFDAADWDVL